MLAVAYYKKENCINSALLRELGILKWLDESEQ